MLMLITIFLYVLVIVFFICCGIMGINAIRLRQKGVCTDATILNIYKETGYDADIWYLQVEYLVEGVKYQLQKPVGYKYIKQLTKDSNAVVKYLETNPKIAKIIEQNK